MPRRISIGCILLLLAFHLPACGDSVDTAQESPGDVVESETLSDLDADGETYRDPDVAGSGETEVAPDDGSRGLEEDAEEGEEEGEQGEEEEGEDTTPGEEAAPLLPACQGDFDALVPSGSMSAVPGELVYWRESPASRWLVPNRIYTTSPSIVVLPNGDYLIAFNLFGGSLSPSAEDSGTTYIYRSSDRGLSWENLTSSAMMNMKRGSLFVFDGDVYLWGYNAAPGQIVIRKSSDRGETWTVPKDAMSGLLTSATRSGTPLNPVVHQGRLWMAVGGQRIMSISTGRDFLVASGWAGPSPAANTEQGPLGSNLNLTEAQIVASPHTGPVVMPKVDGIAYTALIRATGNRAVADPTDADWVPLPGGDKKFGAQYDPISQRFYVLSNPVLPFHRGHGNLTPQLIRNTGAMLSSADLKHWDVEQLFLYSPHIDYEAFQYFNFDIEGDDLLIASRTAFDIGGTFRPPRGHDSNLITFHRIEDFRSATPCHFLRINGNSIQRYELTQHAPAPLGSFVLGNAFDGMPLGTITGIAPEAHGHVLVREQSGRILRFDALGNFLRTESSSARVFQNTALGISQPPRGERTWLLPGGGNWMDLDNWYYWGRPDTGDEVANFGSAITSASTIAINHSYLVKGLRFRSEHRYTLQGSGALELDAEAERGLLEAERGNHRIEVPVTLRTKVDALVQQASSVRITGAINLNGKELSIAGSGALELQGDVIMNGGRVVVDGLSALRFLNPLGATLNGALHFQPDASLELREDTEFVLMNVSNGLAGEFEEVLLPDLPDGLVWDASRLYSQGIVQIIGET